jgi:hypothetical protein
MTRKHHHSSTTSCCREVLRAPPVLVLNNGTVQYCSKGIYAQQYLNRADLQTSTWLSLSQTRTTQPGHSGPISSVPCRHFSFKLVQYIIVESSESRRSSFSLDGRGPHGMCVRHEKELTGP